MNDGLIVNIAAVAYARRDHDSKKMYVPNVFKSKGMPHRLLYHFTLIYLGVNRCSSF